MSLFHMYSLHHKTIGFLGPRTYLVPDRSSLLLGLSYLDNSLSKLDVRISLFLTHTRFLRYPASSSETSSPSSISESVGAYTKKEKGTSEFNSRPKKLG